MNRRLLRGRRSLWSARGQAVAYAAGAVAEVLEGRHLLSTVLFEGFEGSFPSANGWSVGDAASAGTPAYWGGVDSAFGGESPYSGTRKGYCAGIGYAGTSSAPVYQNAMTAYMSRSINLAGFTNATLSFRYKIPSIEAGSYDHLSVSLGSASLFDVSTPVTSWTQATFDLSLFVGSSYTLKFEFYSDPSGTGEGAYLDDISVTGSPDTVTIGTGTGTWNYPFGSNYHDARTQAIYLASEIGSSGNISSLALDVTQIPGQTLNNFTIRMKQTSLSAYSSASWDGSGWTTVYQNSETISTTGWRTFAFATPFAYSNSSNLLVDFSFNNSSYSSDGLVRYSSTAGNRSLYYRTNGGYGDPLTWSGTSPLGTLAARTPNVRLVIAPGQPAPTNVTASDGTFNDKVRITWTAAAGATGYEVWRNTTNSSASATKVTASDVTGTTYDDTSAVAGTTYYYWVKAKNADGTSDFSASDSGYRLVIPGAPTGVVASDGTYLDKVRVSWTATAMAESYLVWRSTSNDSSTATVIHYVTSTSYDDYLAPIGQTCYYWVTAANTLGTSGFSLPDSGYRLPSAPTYITASNGTYVGKVQVSWPASAGATGYELWRNTTNNSSSASLVASGIGTTSYDDFSAAMGPTYYYWVKASAEAGTSAFSPSSSGYVMRIPAAPTTVTATDGRYAGKVSLSWSASTYATGYEVWRNTSNDISTATKITTDDLTGTTYDDSTALAQTTYYYWVTAKNAAGTSAFGAAETGYLASVVFVDQTATGTGDGASWNNAFTSLQAAIGAVGFGYEIRIAAGVYKPTDTADRAITFQLKNGVTLLGGYAGIAASNPEVRDITLYSTVLSGDIGVAGDNTDNTYHVISASSVDATAVIDGLTITGGNATGAPTSTGGGMYNSNSSPTISACTFIENTAPYAGGGIYNTSSSPRITDSAFIRNTTPSGGGGGGGMCNSSSSAPILTNCTFTGNIAFQSGGGMSNSSSSPTLVNCTFTGNATISDVINFGAGMSNYLSSPTLTSCTFVGNTTAFGGSGGGMDNYNSSSPRLTNCIFRGNTANRGGGMDNDYSSAPVLVNCEFSGNAASGDGGGMANASSSPVLYNSTLVANTAGGGDGGGIYNFNSPTRLSSCIVWGNSAPRGAQIYDVSSTPTITYSDIQGGYTGTGNINADPLFVRSPSAGLDGQWGSTDDDYGDLRLKLSSPAIDAGTNAGLYPTDLAGLPRRIDVPTVANTGSGASPIVDMGAYEFQPPMDITLSSGSAAENQAIGAVVGTLGTIDADPTNTFTYALISGTGSTDNGSFTISGDQLLTTASFDYETRSGYSIRVRTTDLGGLWFEKVLTITVTNVNETPTDLSLSASSVAENQPSGTVVGDLSSTDPDAGNSFTYSLVSGTGSEGNAAFTISGSQLLTTAGFDYEDQSSYAVRLRATDQDGLYVERTFTISVTDVDEIAPTISATSINDGAAQRSMVKKLSVTFSEPVALSADALQVKLSNGALPANTSVTVTNPSGDQQTYVLSFSGSAVIGGSLADGVYDLIVSSAGVQDLQGNVLTANYTRRFHRLFGDSDGNRIVNALDYARLKNTLGRSPADPLFNGAFDYEGNNLINALDLARFRQRYGMVYSY